MNITGIENIIQLFNNKYIVTSNGEVLIGATGYKVSKHLDRYGYYKVQLNFNKFKKIVSVHRLVSQQFIPNPKGLSQINHKNGVKTDNRVINLEWCTGSENVKHAHDIGLHSKPKGSKNNMSKLTEKEALEIYNSTDETKVIIGEYNVSRSNVDAIKSGSLWSHVTGHKYEKKKFTNCKRKLVIDLENGIFYDSVVDAANSRGIPSTTLTGKLNGRKTNNTSFRCI